MAKTVWSILLLETTIVCPLTLQAQRGAEELAKAAQNPVANMISVPFQNNVNFNVGPKEQTENVLNIQPVVPFVLNSDWNLITRTVVPVISQPDFGVSGGGHSGIGDIQLSTLFSPSRPTSSGWIWGVGAIAQLPTADNEALGQGKWGLGPTAVAVRLEMGSPWVYGALINNVWSVGGDGVRPEVDQMLFQPFVNYNFPSRPGLYLGSSLSIAADWKADSHDMWTVPLGLGIGQIFRIGRLPVNASRAAYKNVVRPENAAEWTLRLQAQLLFPK